MVSFEFLAGLIEKPEVRPGFDTRVRPLTFVSPSMNSRGAVVSYWRKYGRRVLV